MNFKNMDVKPSSNSGGEASTMYVIPTSWLTAEGTPVDTTTLTPTNVDVADMAALTAIATPANGDTANVVSNGNFYKYVLADTAWVRISPVINNDDFTYALGKGFLKVETTQDKNDYSSEVSTEKDVTGKKLKPVFAIPGHGVDQLEFEKLLTTTPVVILRVSNDGEIIQYGSMQSPVSVSTKEFQKGQDTLNYKGIVYEAEAWQASPIHYMGSISVYTV